MNRTEAQRLVAAVNALRPDWPTKSLMTLIETELHERSYRDAAVALTWIATDPLTRTPKRVTEAGPWWHASPGHVQPTRRLDPAETCRVCTKDRNACERLRGLTGDDHEFAPRTLPYAVDANGVLQEQTDTAVRVAAARELLALPAPAAEPRPTLGEVHEQLGLPDPNVLREPEPATEGESCTPSNTRA